MAQAKPNRPLSNLAVISITAIVFLAALAGLAVWEIKHQQAASAQSREAFRAWAVAAVKSGRDTMNVWDPELVAQLADDADCRENLESIWFDMTDVSDPRFERIGEFTNLRSIGFYDCRGADQLLVAAQDLPALESLSFRATPITEQGQQTLTSMSHLKEIYFKQPMLPADMDRLKTLLPDADITFEVDDRRATQDLVP